VRCVAVVWGGRVLALDGNSDEMRALVDRAKRIEIRRKEKQTQAREERRRDVKVFSETSSLGREGEKRGTKRKERQARIWKTHKK